VLFFSLGIIIASPVNAVIKIMPLGDSITQGYSSGVSDPDYMVSYRKSLWDLLEVSGYELDFVGSLNNGSAVFGDLDLADHEGHPGWRDDEIVNGRLTDPSAGKLEDWLIAEQPNIVLLHIGTNGLDPSSNDVRDILNLVDNYENNFGEVVWVILARIINRNIYSSTTTVFNDNIENMAKDRINNPSNPAYPDKIIIVDMEDGAGINYDLTTDNPPGDMWNDLHPFETGYDKMAEVWFSGLQAILPAADAGSDQNEYEGTPVTLDASGSSDPNGLIVSYFWEQQPGGSLVILSDPMVVNPSFTTPDVGLGGETLTFKVTVTDNDGLESTDTTNVNVSNDNCPNDPNKTEPGVCGCGISDTDNDFDGTPDCNDNCPNDPGKTIPGICGCGISDIDSDGDGTPNCNDNCPNDPNKTEPGVCGCSISDADTDLDGTPDCNDNCDNDPNKTQPGICGCGISDTDSDGDGTVDCNDGCPNDPGKAIAGICGCGISDTDSDGDGTVDCVDTNDDNDGLFDGEEQGPNGNDPSYDGNNDGIADRLQDNVSSLHTYDGNNYVTIESPVGTSISNCDAVGNPSSTNAPSSVKFSYGFFKFTIDGVGIGSSTTVTLHLPVGETIDTYYKFGSTPNNTTNHWYEFLYDGQTGAEISGNVITLYFIDGMRGDDDLAANGIVIDDGAPAVFVGSGGGTTVTSDGGGGGGGCFIATAAYGSLMEPHVKILRDFRDRFLIGNTLGDSFIRFYYTYSPPIANFIAKHDNLRAVVRLSLLPVVSMSWVALKIGPVLTVALMPFFISCIIWIVWLRRRYNE